jgi:hypothetical protein
MRSSLGLDVEMGGVFKIMENAGDNSISSPYSDVYVESRHGYDVWLTQSTEIAPAWNEVCVDI